MARWVESFQEFAARQGCEHVASGQGALSVRTGEPATRLVFANGAVSDGRENHFEPPADPRQLLAVRREFVSAKLAREVREWTAFRDGCLQQAALARQYPRTCPTVPSEAPEQLRRGRARIAAMREELAAIDGELEDPGRRERERIAREQEHEVASRQTALANEIAGIQL